MLEGIKSTNQWVGLYAKEWVDPGVRRWVFKIAATSGWFLLHWLRRKVSGAKGNPSLYILEYSTLRPKFKTQILISKSIGAKFSRWHLGINSFSRQLGSLLELSRWHLGMTSFMRQLGSSLGLEIPLRFFSGIPLWFPPLGFTMILLSCGTTYLPVGFLLCFPFPGELNQLPTFPSTQSTTTYI